MNARLAMAGGFLMALVSGAAFAGTPAGPAPVLTRTAPGRFEIASVDMRAAERAMNEADAAWRWLRGPLSLPDAFPSPIFVRLVPAEEWTDVAPFRVIAEPGGVVSARVRSGESMPAIFLRRALVQALLLRIGVAAEGVSPRLTVPLWLELGCIAWWRTREEPAQLDALQQESERLPPPGLDGILNWQRSDVEPGDLRVGAAWLLVWLQLESGGAGEWASLRGRLLGGAEPAAALNASYPGRFSDARDRELWWQTGWHHVRRLPTQPLLGIAESRALLGDAARLVFAVGGRDTVVPLRFALRRRGEPAVAGALAARAAEVQRRLPALHPFYRNAGIALAECFEPKRRSLEEAAAACAEFEREWADAMELEAASREALDALGRGR